ncbi:MAG: hypothetical protein LLF92_08660 [Planctomycetaceae bacterium]|nr:hypothetical protein [Planctomycetaceae bacterium]
MANFVWTVKNKSGNTVVKEISAETIGESKAILEAEGYTDLHLQADEIVDFVFQKSDTKFTPSLFKKYLKRPRTILGAFLRSIIQGWFIYLIGISTTIINHQVNGKFPIPIIILMIGWPFFRTWISLPTLYYDKLNKAKDWHQWEKVLKIAHRLKLISKFNFVKFPPDVLKRVRAQALAGLGNLPLALEEYQQKDLKIPDWLYTQILI